MRRGGPTSWRAGDRGPNVHSPSATIGVLLTFGPAARRRSPTCAGTAGHELLPAGGFGHPRGGRLAPITAWAYRLDGALHHGGPAWREVPGFDPAEHGLVELPGRRVGGGRGRTAVELQLVLSLRTRHRPPATRVDFWGTSPTARTGPACESVQRGVASPQLSGRAPSPPKEDAVPPVGRPWWARALPGTRPPALTQACRSSRPTAAGWQPDRRESR